MEEVFAACSKFYGCAHRMRHSKHIHIHGEVYGGPREERNLSLRVDVTYAFVYLVRFL